MWVLIQWTPGRCGSRATPNHSDYSWAKSHMEGRPGRSWHTDLSDSRKLEPTAPSSRATSDVHAQPAGRRLCDHALVYWRNDAEVYRKSTEPQHWRRYGGDPVGFPASGRTIT